MNFIEWRKKNMTLIDYEKENFCSHCRIKVPKDQIRCVDCNWLVRTKAIKCKESQVTRY